MSTNVLAAKNAKDAKYFAGNIRPANQEHRLKDAANRCATRQSLSELAMTRL
jgi:hypothetical protein